MSAPSESDSDMPEFDRAGVLARLMNDEGLAGRIIARFLDSLSRQIESLRKASESRDAAVAKRHAHSIKGAASNVGAERLSQVAFLMEQALQNGAFDVAKGHFAEMELEFERVRKAMSALHAQR